MHNKLSLLFIFIFSLSFAQSDGYWDKERTTSKEVVVGARDRIIIPILDLPEGTTEIVYRITLLDENQQLSGSLISILKAIPDPTGISQGSAGAIFLLSKVAGNDQCKYAIFTSREKALAYKKDGIDEKACLYQNNPVNKDARRITYQGTTCFRTGEMWFGFESKNWILNQKIVLEVVPWVDAKRSRGWTTERKLDLINSSKDVAVYSLLNKKDEFSACYLESIEKKFSYREYKGLLEIELKRESDAITESCLLKTGESSKLLQLIRDKASKLFESGKSEAAIETIQTEIIDAKKATAMDYFDLGNYYLLTKQFSKAESSIEKGILIDSEEINLQLALAHLYLFTDRISEAKEIHKKHQDQNVSPAISWNKQVEKDFATFKKYGFPTKNFKKIRRILE